MKIVIWIVCIFGIALVQTALKMNGIILGGIPTALLYLVCMGIARALCKAWDNRKR